MSAISETLRPWRVCSFESRRANEMQSLLERHGLIGTVAPSMKEVPLEENQAALDFAAELLAGRFDVVVFLTGVGAQTLFDAVMRRYPRDEFLAALNRCRIVVRGPKPVAVLHAAGVHIDLRAPEPNTWRELLAALEAAGFVAGQRIALQEYGIPQEELRRQLEARGASVRSVPVYRWELPDDIQPLRAAIGRTISGEFDALLFTSAQQLEHVLRVAEETSSSAAWLAAAAECVIASIGPTASETIRRHGLPVHLEPAHPKMGILVRELAEALPRLRAARKT
jgi:uroporphyrinogen-III synthase